MDRSPSPEPSILQPRSCTSSLRSQASGYIKRTLGLLPPPPPPKHAPLVEEKSVASLGMLTYWNGLSGTIGDLDHDRPDRHLRLATTPSRLTLFSDTFEEDMKDGHALLPPMTPHVTHTTEPLPTESFSSFMDRMLQPQACQLEEHRSSNTELPPLSPSLSLSLSPTKLAPEVAFEGEGKYPEWEWAALEHEILDLASTLKGTEGAYATVSDKFAQATHFDKTAIKVVDIANGRSACQAQQSDDRMPAVVKFKPTALSLDSSCFVFLPEDLATPSPSIANREDSTPVLPYQAYQGAFDPFGYNASSDTTMMTTKQDRRNYTIDCRAGAEADLTSICCEHGHCEHERGREDSSMVGHVRVDSLNSVICAAFSSDKDYDSEHTPPATWRRGSADSIVPQPLNLGECAFRRQASIISRTPASPQAYVSSERVPTFPVDEHGFLKLEPSDTAPPIPPKSPSRALVNNPYLAKASSTAFIPYRPTYNTKIEIIVRKTSTRSRKYKHFRATKALETEAPRPSTNGRSRRREERNLLHKKRSERVKGEHKGMLSAVMRKMGI